MRIIVTGASRGIGRGIATALSAAGHSVGLVARSDAALARVQAGIRASGGTCSVAAADLRDPEAVGEAFKTLIGDLEGVDGLVNNAGLIVRKDVFEIGEDEWRAMMETNINGPFYCCRNVLPRMREQGHGHIVNVSSISGYMPLPAPSRCARSTASRAPRPAWPSCSPRA